MIGIIILTITALIMSIILVFLNNEDTFKSDKYLEYLPGYNCGACGFGSCKGMSEKMVEDVDNYKKCKPLRGLALEKMEEFLGKK